MKIKKALSKISFSLLVLFSFCFFGCNEPDGNGSGINKDEDYIAGNEKVVDKNFVSVDDNEVADLLNDIANSIVKL